MTNKNVRLQRTVSHLIHNPMSALVFAVEPQTTVTIGIPIPKPEPAARVWLTFATVKYRPRDHHFPPSAHTTPPKMSTVTSPASHQGRGGVRITVWLRASIEDRAR